MRRQKPTPLRIATLTVISVAALITAVLGSSITSSAKSSGSTFPGAYGTIPAQSGTPSTGGTVTYAESPGAGPNYIFPITPGSNSSVFVAYQFQYLSWRPLYWAPNGATPEIDPALSLASAPTFSNGDKTVTIRMNQNYTWSANGAPVDANDVVFDIDLIKAAVKESSANWGNYTPGDFPDNVVSAVATSKYTVTLTLNKKWNPGWFYLNELSLVVPLPSTYWNKSSATGSALDYTVPANATAIYDFLNAQSSDLSTYSANPLWKDVDGPYTLSTFHASNNQATFTANKNYTGANKPHITTVEELPYTSTQAEFNQLLSGTLDAGYVDFTDLPQVKRLQAKGYNVFGYPDYGFDYMPINFQDTTGHWNSIASQLYVRDALQSLENEPAWVKGIFDGAAVASYGVVPKYPATQYQPKNAVDPAFPYSLTKAKSLLASHGWSEVKGVMTCTKAGKGSSECGAGIPKHTKLSFNLIYSTSPAAIGLQVTSFAAAAAQIGVKISTTSSSFANILKNEDDVGSPSTKNKWAMANFGGFTNSLYPTTNTLFNTTGSYNLGGFSEPTANSLISASVAGGNSTAVKSELTYIDAHYPGLWEPQPDLIYAWKKSLSGPPPSFATLTQYFFNPEEWYYKK